MTEIERFPETEAEGESTKQGWGPSAETEVADKTERPAHRREQRRGKEEERVEVEGEQGGRGGERDAG